MREAKLDMLAYTCNLTMMEDEVGDHDPKGSLRNVQQDPFREGREGEANQITEIF